jgi:hypothetical protein
MYQLTIGHPGGDTTSDHADLDTARAALLAFAVAADYYLRPLQATADAVGFALIALPGPEDRARHPRTAGQAHITRGGDAP